MEPKYEHKAEQFGASFDTGYKMEEQCIPDCPACAFEAGIMEVAEWLKDYLIYIALKYDGTPVLYLQTNGKKSADKWQAKLKEWRNRKGGKR